MTSQFLRTGTLGILCGFENRGQVAFDARTLDLVALEGPFAEGWRGGGHAEFIDDGRMVVLSERAPRRAAVAGQLEQQYGRITIRGCANPENPGKLLDLRH